jgi:hypothetical protein
LITNTIIDILLLFAHEYRVFYNPHRCSIQDHTILCVTFIWWFSVCMKKLLSTNFFWTKFTLWLIFCWNKNIITLNFKNDKNILENENISPHESYVTCIKAYIYSTPYTQNHTSSNTNPLSHNNYIFSSKLYIHVTHLWGQHTTN